MTAEQIKMVKRTWKIMMGIDPVLLGETFYGKLFNDHPELRPYFPRDMKEQYIKLTDMLSSIILRLDNQNLSSIIEMGKRHAGYGVKLAHYNMVGSAMIWMLSKALGTEWNQATEEAWVQCYTEISAIMTSAA